MSLFVVDEEGGAANDVAEERWENAKEDELSVRVEVSRWQESRALVFHQGGSHGPGDQDVDASQSHRPADFGAFVNLVLF